MYICMYVSVCVCVCVCVCVRVCLFLVMMLLACLVVFNYYDSLFTFSSNGVCAPMEKWHTEKDTLLILSLNWCWKWGWVDELVVGWQVGLCGWVVGWQVWMSCWMGGWMAGGVVVGWQVLCRLLVVNRGQKGKSHFCLLFSERKKSKKDREASN